MDFDAFIPFALRLKDVPLPGEKSHYKMAPSIRKKEIEALPLEARNPRKAAVMALFYPDEARATRLLLTMRKQYNGVHSGQIGFPGGKLETEDSGYESAALRETYEEVGVAPDRIEVFKRLSDIYIPPSNYMVRPFMGLIRKRPLFRPQDTEVEQVIEVLLSDFLDDSAVHDEILDTSYAKNIRTPVFKLNGYTVWGATAMILSEVKELLKA